MINPTFVKADHLISLSRKYKQDDWHYLSLLKKIESSKLQEIEKIELYFSLSKANEDLNNISEAYKFLKKGNDLNKKKIKYEINTDLKLIENIKDLFEKIDFKKFSNKNSDKIIFILGMPRSGTSLIEQIISSHSKVIGGGEMPIMSNLVKKNFIDDEKISKSKFIETVETPSKLLTIANEYFDFVNYFDVRDKIIIDKAPLNLDGLDLLKYYFKC